MTAGERALIPCYVAAGLVAVLALQPLAYITVLTWAWFVHVLLVAAGMGYLLWRERRRANAQK